MSSHDPPRAWRWAFVLAALAVSATMVVRSRPSGDQLELLARGWLLAERGELVPWGNPLSSGGLAPGPATSWAVGLPLEIWRDHRAPAAAIWLLHLGALLVLDRALRPALTPIERTAYLVLWTVVPWRLEASGFVWNPNYLFAVGAIHLASAEASRERPSFAATFLHVATLGVAAQLHPSVLLLGVLSALLWWRGLVRPSWSGFAAGVAVSAVALLPWLLAPAMASSSDAGTRGFLFRGLVLVQPWLKGLSYWLRYPALSSSSSSVRFDFTETFGSSVDAWSTPAALGLAIAAGVATVAFAGWANWRWLREAGAYFRKPWRGGPPRDWLSAYAFWALVAMALVFAASPTTPQGWQGFPLFHATLVPVVFGIGALVPRWGERRVMAGLAAAGVAALAIDAAIAFGAPNFRCTGRHSDPFPLRAWSPMFFDLGIQRDCPRTLGVAGGWWPSVLPEEAPRSPGEAGEAPSSRNQ